MRINIYYIFAAWLFYIASCQLPPVEEQIPPKVHEVVILEPIPIQNVVGFADLKMECSASGNPAPTIEWSFNGVKFVKDQPFNGVEGAKIRHILKGNRITIKGVKGKYNDESDKHDTGRYRCIARNEVGAVFLEKYIQIRVMAKFNSQRNYLQKDNTIEIKPTVGKSAIVKCPAHKLGYGCEYSWGAVDLATKKTEYFYSGNPNKRMFIKNNGDLVYSYVDQFDILQSSSLGGLSCIITNYGQTVASNKYMFLTAYETVLEDREPFLAAHMPITMRGAVDRPFVLTCGATGRPLPEYRWEYQGVPIRSVTGDGKLNFEFFEFFGNKMELRIRRLTKYSGGTFRCYAKNRLGETHRQGQLTVLFPPKWKNVLPDTIDLPLGNRFELICNATGFPTPKVEWFQNGTRLFSSQDKRKKVVGDGKNDYGGVLTIEETRFIDNGIYICVAYNELDTLTMSTFIRIKEMKPEFRVPLDDPIYLFRTSTMMIHCKPLGGPVPEKTWKRDNVDIVDGGRYKILKNGSLQISNVQESDAGKYRCTAVNVLGSAFSEGTAVVLEPTVITNHIESRREDIGWDYTELFCGASWDKKLDLRIEWYKGGVRMTKFTNRVYLEERATGPPRLLFIRKLTVDDAGMYSCRAYTTVGNVISEKWSHANLTVKAPPEPPTGLLIDGNCYNKDKEDVILRWHRGEQIGVPIRKYFVEFSTNQSSHANKWFGGKGDPLIPNSKMIATASSKVIEFKLNRFLVPGANLIFRLIAASDLLTGRPSRPTSPDTCNTKAGKPVINPVNVTGIVYGVGKLSIRWRPVTDVYFGGDNFEYEVNYRKVGEKLYQKKPVTDLNQTEYAITSPGEYIQYQFYVLSKNKEGYGPDIRTEEIKTAYSGRKAPEFAPNNVRVGKITIDNVELYWSPAKDADGYRVRYWNITNTEHLRGRSGRSRRAASDSIVYKYQTFMGEDYSNGVTLSNLTSQVDFLATVAAVNNGGAGPESGLIEFTSSARIPGYVSDVHLQIYGRSVHINWNPPLNPNGYIESYEIRWIETRNEGDTRPAKEERLTMDRRSREAYLINKMTPLTYFDVTIRARNRLGPGRPWVRERFAVSAEDIPGKPGAPKAKPFDDTAINVTFQRPSYGGLPTKFYVYYRPTGHFFDKPKRLSQSFPNRAWTLVMGLDFLVYDFWTVGVNSMGQSETSDVTEQQPVRRPKPQSHASQFDWYESNWFIAVGMCMLFLCITVIVVVFLLRGGPKPYKRLRDRGYGGYGGGNRGAQEMSQLPPKSSNGAYSRAAAEAPLYDKDQYDVRRHLSASEPASEPDVPPPRYSSQSSLEKKALTASEDGSETGSGSDYSDSETGTGSDYSDEEQGSYYSDEEKKRDSEEDEEEEEDISTFV